LLLSEIPIIIQTQLYTLVVFNASTLDSTTYSADTETNIQHHSKQNDNIWVQSTHLTL
jgi:hypothetical protein